MAAPSGVRRTAALFSPLEMRDMAALVPAASADPGEAILQSIGRWWDKAAALDEVGRALYVDARTSLSDDLLLVADKVSMAHSLEARVPYLDLDYLRVLEAIPGTERVAAFGRRKPVQLAIARKVLPSELNHRLQGTTSPLRKKRGFDVPVAQWFRSSLGGNLITFLTGPRSLLPQYISAAEVQPRVASYLRGTGSAFRFVLSLYVLELWLRGVAGYGPGKTAGVPG